MHKDLGAFEKMIATRMVMVRMGIDDDGDVNGPNAQAGKGRDKAWLITRGPRIYEDAGSANKDQRDRGMRAHYRLAAVTLKTSLDKHMHLHIAVLAT